MALSGVDLRRLSVGLGRRGETRWATSASVRRSASCLACGSISARPASARSLGGHGATVNVGKNGPNVTLGAPGTGLSYRTPLSSVLVVGIDLGRGCDRDCLPRCAGHRARAPALVAAALVLSRRLVACGWLSESRRLQALTEAQPLIGCHWRRSLRGRRLDSVCGAAALGAGSSRAVASSPGTG